MGFTNVGLTKVRDYLIGASSTTRPGWIATGTGTTAFTAADTALETEIDRNAQETPTSTATSVSYTATFGISEANGNTLKEAGLFDAASAGNMFVRFNHGSIVKTTSIELQYEIIVRLSN